MCAGSRVAIRELALGDLPQLIELCAEHAAYERMPFERNDQHESLRRALERRVIFGWVAESKRSLCGYATATIDFSTWRAASFMHLDCLYVRDAHRDQGVGRQLMHAVIENARARGIRELQWQTPDWNTDADRFYRRFGAVARAKLRYSLPLTGGGIVKQFEETN